MKQIKLKLFIGMLLVFGFVVANANAQSLQERLNTKLKDVIAPEVENSLKEGLKEINTLFVQKEEQLNVVLEKKGLQKIELPRLPEVESTLLKFNTLDEDQLKVDFSFAATFVDNQESKPVFYKPSIDFSIDLSGKTDASIYAAITTGFELHATVQYFGQKSFDLISSADSSSLGDEEKQWLERILQFMKNLADAENDPAILLEVADTLRTLREEYLKLPGGTDPVTSGIHDVVKALEVFVQPSTPTLAGIELDSDDLQEFSSDEFTIAEYVKSFALGFYLASEDQTREFKEGEMTLKRGVSLTGKLAVDKKSEAYTEMLLPLAKNLLEVLPDFADSDALDEQLIGSTTAYLDFGFEVFSQYFVALTDAVIESHGE
jgi:hypothetical protein